MKNSPKSISGAIKDVVFYRIPSWRIFFGFLPALLICLGSACGMEHLKRSDIGERTDVSVVSPPPETQVFGTDKSAAEDASDLQTDSSTKKSPAGLPKNPSKPPIPTDTSPASSDEGSVAENMSPATETVSQDESVFVDDAGLPEDQEFAGNEDLMDMPADDAPPAFDWQRVLLTEIVTDPQQDHNGSGNVSTSDEYVEIFNGTDFSLDISGWRLNMRDGTDESQVLDGSGADYFFIDGGNVTNFGSGELLLVVNPRGTMNNSIEMELIDEFGFVVDSVLVDDANASGVEDEAFFLDEAGVWGMGVATPGDLF